MATTRKPDLRAVEEGDRPAKKLTLLEAEETGDVLQILLAQRRFIVESLAKAAENTRPQYNNELNKLHALIAAEEARRAGDDQGERAGTGERRRFDAAAI